MPTPIPVTADNRPAAGLPQPQRQSRARARPSAATPAATEVRERLKPDDWIAAATDVLVDQGIDHVRVDLLATRLRVTRGSFYWHFKDREELLRSVLQQWSEHTTRQLTLRLESAHADPRQQLLDVMSLPFRGRAALRAARIELAIRAWARRDAVARQTLDAADAARLRYHEQIFQALGFDADQAKARAFVSYSYEVAESLLTRQGTPQQKQLRSAMVAQWVMQPQR